MYRVALRKFSGLPYPFNVSASSKLSFLNNNVTEIMQCEYKHSDDVGVQTNLIISAVNRHRDFLPTDPCEINQINIVIDNVITELKGIHETTNFATEDKITLSEKNIILLLSSKMKYSNHLFITKTFGRPKCFNSVTQNDLWSGEIEKFDYNIGVASAITMKSEKSGISIEKFFRIPSIRRTISPLMPDKHEHNFYEFLSVRKDSY